MIGRRGVVIGAALLLGCGGASKTPAKRAEASRAPRWEDAFDLTPDVLAMVRPRAIAHDAVYGPLLRRAFALAAEKSRFVAATRALDAIERSDEVILAMRETADRQDQEVALVLRGVSADLDAATIVGTDGKPMWRRVHAYGAVPELQREETIEGSVVGASLFVLPERTWLIAVGDARDRARDAFASPSGRPSPSFEEGALAAIRFEGAPLVRHVDRLREGRPLAAVGHHLRSLLLTLRPGREGLLAARFAYHDEESASVAEMTLRDVRDAIARHRPKSLVWLEGAALDRETDVVVARERVPSALLRDLAHASSEPAEVPNPAK